MKRFGSLMKIWLASLILGLSTVVYSAGPPNVLFIAVDDLNDWIGCMGGHSQAKTPNLDRLAKRGVLFTNAHCQSPVCNPSRASLMISRYPESTGLYFLEPLLSEANLVKPEAVMPLRFQQEGWHVAGGGKIFHYKGNEAYVPNWAGYFGGFGPFPEKKLSLFPGLKLWDWGAFPERDDLMPDYKTASWAEQQLAEEREGPFFLLAGFLTPHVPQYAPQKWMDLYPLETLELPAVEKHDLEDISRYAIDLTRKKHVAPTHKWVLENDQWKPLVQTYLACVSFMDHQLGRILDALDASPYADNTILVLFSDHGFHLGEKERWAKRSIWSESSRVPLMIAGPGVAAGTICDKPVQLLDLYPTLLDLCGLKADKTHEGHSLAPLLKNPDAAWPHVARTSFGPGNLAITSEQYRYLRYSDGSEELYDRENDSHEWSNLFVNPQYEEVLEWHRSRLPKEWVPMLGKGSTGHSAYEAAATSNNRRDK